MLVSLCVQAFAHPGLEDSNMANEQASGLQGVRKWVAENKLRAVGAPHDLTLRAPDCCS